MISANPLHALVPYLAGRTPPSSPLVWAAVAAVAPRVTVRIVGTDPEDPPVEVLPLAPVHRLAVGARVLVLHLGTTVVLLGRTYGGESDHSAWTALALSDPWTQYGAVTSWGSPALRVVDGVVQLRGMATGGTTGTSSEPLAVLPAWARPARARIGLAVAADTAAPFQVGPDGALFLRSAFSGGWVSLSSISYPL